MIQGILIEMEGSVQLTSLFELVQISCFSCSNFNFFIFLNKKNLSYEEMNCTEPSLSVRHPCGTNYCSCQSLVAFDRRHNIQQNDVHHKDNDQNGIHKNDVQKKDNNQNYIQQNDNQQKDNNQNATQQNDIQKKDNTKNDIHQNDAQQKDNDQNDI
jgi:hypothetical protein